MRAVVFCIGLLFIVGCSDAAKKANDLLLTQKDELVGKVEKMLPEAKSIMDDLTKKIGESSGASKFMQEKILANLQKVYKEVTEKIAELKKGGMEGLKDKIAALTKYSDILPKVMADAKSALTNKDD